MSTRAALRYAKAVYSGAQEANTQELIYGNMKSIADTLAGSDDLKIVLESPHIKNEDKRASLHAIFSDVSEITTSLIDILIDNGRIKLLEKVALQYIDLYNEDHGIVVAEVTTAIDLDASLEQKILTKVKELTEAKEVILKQRIDENILGGFIIRVKDIQYDASVSNQLDKVHKEFSKRL